MSSFPKAKGGELEKNDIQDYEGPGCSQMLGSAALACSARVLFCIQPLVEAGAARSFTASRRREERWEKNKQTNKPKAEARKK